MGRIDWYGSEGQHKLLVTLIQCFGYSIWCLKHKSKHTLERQNAEISAQFTECSG